MNFPTSELISFGKQFGLPSYIKAASTKNFEEISDPQTKVGCYLAKFASLNGTQHISTSELNKRAQILNISEDIAQLDHDYRAFQNPAPIKTAAPTEKYPIRNANEYIAALEWLKKNAYAIPLPERRELAENLLEKAASFDVEADECLTMYAGQRIGDIKQIIPNLLKRAELIRNSRLHPVSVREKTASELEAVAELANLQPNNTLQQDNLDKIAATLQFIDNEYGLQGHYSNGFINEPDAVFVHGTKVAEDILEYGYQYHDAVYDMRDFEQIKVAAIIETLGEDFASVMTDGLSLDHQKIGTVLSVMTDLEKTMFNDLIKEAGIRPKFYHRETVNLKELGKELANLA